MAVVFVDDINGVLPALFLAGVEFAEMEDLALDGAPVVNAQAFAHRVIDMVFAVYVADTSFQKHAPWNYGMRCRIKGVGRPTGGLADPPLGKSRIEGREK